MFPSSSTGVINGYQLFVKELAAKRPSLEFFDENIFSNGGPKPKSLIEIVGPTNCGKSQLLWYIMVRSLLPYHCGGKYCNVIFINLAHKFHLRHFRNYLEHMLTQTTTTSTKSTYTPNECQTITYNCLNSVTAFDCFTIDQFEMVFAEIEDVLLDNENIALIALDSLDAFYWLDAAKKPIRMTTYYTKWLGKLKKLCDEHNVCCVYTVDTDLAAKVDYKEKNRLVEYQLNINAMADGKKTVNNQSFTIDKNGVHFNKIR